MGKKICIYENDVDKAWYDSSTVVYSECDDKENSLKTVKVVFKNGSTYLYKDVKVNDYLLFRESASQGKAIHRIFNGYEYEKIENSDVNLLLEEYDKLIERIKEEQNKKHTYVISAFPGCGKTTAYQRLKEKIDIVDLESSFFDKNAFPQNYIDVIKEKMGKVDIIFVSSHEKVRQSLQNEGIEYVLYYPSYERKDEMVSLYKGRGNEGTFIDLMTLHYEHFLHSVENDNCENKICLKNEGDFIIDNDVFNKILNKIK